MPWGNNGTFHGQPAPLGCVVLGRRSSTKNLRRQLLLIAVSWCSPHSTQLARGSPAHATQTHTLSMTLLPVLVLRGPPARFFPLASHPPPPPPSAFITQQQPPLPFLTQWLTLHPPPPAPPPKPTHQNRMTGHDPSSAASTPQHNSSGTNENPSSASSSSYHPPHPITTPLPTSGTADGLVPLLTITKPPSPSSSSPKQTTNPKPSTSHLSFLLPPLLPPPSPSLDARLASALSTDGPPLTHSQTADLLCDLTAAGRLLLLQQYIKTKKQQKTKTINLVELREQSVGATLLHAGR